MDNLEKKERILQRIEDERGFYSHLIVYIVVNGALFVLDWFSNGHSWWYFPALGWGIGIILHWTRVFGPNWLPSKQWEKKRFEELMKRDLNNFDQND